MLNPNIVATVVTNRRKENENEIKYFNLCSKIVKIARAKIDKNKQYIYFKIILNNEK